MANPFSLEGKVALVTGANTGIGQGIAIALAAAGADIAAAGRSEPTETQKAVEALGRRFLSIKADFGSTEPVQRVVDETVAAFGKADILVNNAGIIRRADSIEFSEADWDAVMDTNLKVVFFLTQAFAKQALKQGGGKVINIASLLSFQGGIRVPSYTAAKSGLAGLTKILANIKEFASLRALGVSMGSLRKVVFELAFWVGVVGLVTTGLFVWGVSALGKAGGVPMAFPLEYILMAVVLLMLIALGSGLLSLGVLKKSQPADLLR